MRLALFVEGHTERKVLPAFLKRWLDPRLPQPVGIDVIRFEGWQHYRREVATKVRLQLSGKRSAKTLAAVGLLDLYGPTIYPADKITAQERYRWAKQQLEKEVGHPRFRQHFAVHELEAWLLAQPGSLRPEIAKALPASIQRPETVDFEEPPKKLLARLYRDKLRKPYGEILDGASLFSRLDPETAAARCPYLRLLLEDLLQLAAPGET